MKNIITLLAMLMLTGCAAKNGGKGAAIADDSVSKTMAVDEAAVDVEPADDVPVGKSLNDIRIADREGEDWLDNDYIRTLRTYIDDFCCGKADDTGLSYILF